MFKDAASSFRGRTGVVAPSAGGDLGLAINADNSNLGDGVAWASDLSFDTIYRTVISWDAATGESNLWLDPTDMSSTSVSHTGAFTGTIIDDFASASLTITPVARQSTTWWWPAHLLRHCLEELQFPSQEALRFLA